MSRRIKIRINEDSRYTIKNLYRHKINIYNIEYKESGSVYTIDERDLDNLLYEDVEILSYKGYKGILVRLMRHRHFLFSFLLSIATIFLMSNFIIDVEVIHSDKKVRELIQEELYLNGIRPLMMKKSFGKIQIIKEKIKESHPEEIEWLEIIDEGMKYTVRIEERIITKEEIVPEYCDIVSTKDAIVTDVISSKGQNQVLANDFVKKGSILVSGAIKFNEEIKSYTCATGTVYGNTWYTVNVSVPYDYVSKKYTGEEAHNIAILSGSKLIEIFKVHLSKYDTTKKKIFGLGNFIFYYETHREYKTTNNKYTEEEAINKALELGREKILLNLEDDAEILNEKVLQRNAYDSIIEVEIFYSVKERIGMQVAKEIPEYEEGVTDESTE